MSFQTDVHKSVARSVLTFARVGHNFPALTHANGLGTEVGPRDHPLFW